MENYKGNLYRLVMVNSTWLVRGMFNFVYPVFDGFTRQKIIMSGDADDSDYKKEIVAKYFNVSKLEKKYGGKMDNITEGNFFPPKI